VLTPQQAALIQKAGFQEKLMVKIIQHHTPLVQTYIQHMRSDRELGSIPVLDEYILGRVDFEKTFNETSYDKHSSKGMLAGSKRFLDNLTKTFKLELSPNGFMDMMFVDTSSFDQKHYNFTYVKQEFIGEIRTAVFDVQPRSGTGSGRFIGRVWIEDQDGNVVRFTGTFSSTNRRNLYFHFDSWRTNVQPFVWLPAAVYVQDQDFQGQTYFWGYSLTLPQHGPTENGSYIQLSDAMDATSANQDVSPLEAHREWLGQSERNVLERLEKAGLVAEPSEFDHLLETITNNIAIGNNINLPKPIRCRVMLTAPLESLSIGNTIILSKGLVDVLPSEEAIAAVLSFQLAHILLGNPVDSRFAFNDRLLFPDEATLQRIAMNHTQAQNEDAAKKAVELLRKSVYNDKLNNAGLFFNQLQRKAKQLPALMTPQLGDSLLAPDGQTWLAALAVGATPLKINDLQQVAALPLGSRLRIDPWSDEVIQLLFPQAQFTSAHDKMPFEIGPVYYRLARYRPPTETPTVVAQTPAQ
jgi:hypothetical protein